MLPIIEPENVVTDKNPQAPATINSTALIIVSMLDFFDNNATTIPPRGKKYATSVSKFISRILADTKILQKNLQGL